LRPAPAITLALRTAPFLALLAGPVTLAGMPAAPAPGRLLASRTAIATLRLRRPEPAFTVFEKTAPLSKPPTRALIGSARERILRWAQGRSLLPKVKPRRRA